MPDNTDKGQDMAPEAVPVEAEEKVKLPPTEAERHAARLETAAKESDDDRSKRRAKEIGSHFEAHKENVAEAHEMFPAPMHRDWERLTDEEKKNWNLRGQRITSANRAYNLAVKRTFADHQAEDRHITKLLATEAAKKENV